MNIKYNMASNNKKKNKYKFNKASMISHIYLFDRIKVNVKKYQRDESKQNKYFVVL